MQGPPVFFVIMYDNYSNTAALIGFGLFVASELVGMSKYRQNSVVQMILSIAATVFPYEIKPRQKHPVAEKLERTLVRPSAAPYTEDVLEDMTVRELRSLARTYGAKELANTGRRSELIGFFLNLVD
jgi:hypothetical protein